MANFVIGAFFSLLMFLTFMDVKTARDYEDVCKNAGGIPAITSHGPNVCINPSAIIEVDQ